MNEGHAGCLGGEATQTHIRASDRRDLYPDLLPRAGSITVVSCERAGPVSIVLEFGSRAALGRAFASSHTARRRAWCFTGAGAFDDPGAYDSPGIGDIRRFCRRLHGRVQLAGPSH
jgi:hypothetical protein